MITTQPEENLVESFYASAQQRWPAGRLDYHWHVLPDPVQTRTALFEPYRELTHRDGLAPVSPDWYHVTVLHSVPVDDVTASQLEQIVAEMRRRCQQIAGFDLTLDRPAVGRAAVECAGRPGAAARDLWRAAATSTVAVLGVQVPVLPAVYYPHLSLGYAVAHIDHRPLKEWLSDHDIAPYTMRVETVSLVAQSHNGHDITWRHILDVPLLG